MSAIAQPLLFLGDRRRQALLSRAGERLRAWRQGWARAGDSFEVSVEPSSASGHGSAIAGITTTCWALTLNSQRIAVLLLPHGSFCWAVQESGGGLPEMPASGAAGSLAEALEGEVARSLLVTLCGLEKADGVAVERIAVELGSWTHEVRAWHLHARPESGGRGFSLLLAASRVELLAPAHAVAAGHALDPRRDAIGGNTVGLRAEVGEAAMSVGELAGLAIDDVLVLDRCLADPVTLVSTRTGAAVATCHLGRSGENRALKIAGVPANKN
jgi:hypothetical protein